MNANLENLKKMFVLISLLGIGALGAACGKSASTGVGADETVVADPGFVQENPPTAIDNPAETPETDVGEEPGETPAPEEPGVGDEPAAPLTCYRYAFVSDRAPAENVFITDTCSQAAPSPLTSNTHVRTHFGHLAFKPDGEALAFGQGTVSIPLREPTLFLAHLGATPISLEILDSGDLGAFDAGVFEPQKLAFEANGSRAAFVGVTTAGVGLGADFRVLRVEELRVYDFATDTSQVLINTLDEERKIGKIAWYDAQHLIFSMRLGTGPSQLYVYDLSDRSFRPLSTGIGPLAIALEGSAPAVKPGSSQLAFVRRIDGKEQIFTCSFVRRGNLIPGAESCSNLRQLTHEGSNEDPAWTPDGKFLFFTSGRDGNENIYQMKKDGSEQSALTQAFSDEKRVAVHPQSFTIP